MFTVVIQAQKQQRQIRLMKLSTIQQGAVKFYLVSVRRGKRMNWNRLEQTLGNAKHRVILAPEIQGVPPASIQLVDDVGFAHVMTRNALRQILEQHKERLRKQAVCLVDIFCRHQEYANLLAEYFSVIYIVTNRRALYLQYQQAKFYEMGATVLIDTCYRAQGQSVALFVSPDGILFPQMEKSSIPIITAKPMRHMEHSVAYHSFCSGISAEHQTICPKEISPRMFQAALYEYCGLRHLASETPTFGMQNYEKKTIEEIIFHIFSIDTQ